MTELLDSDVVSGQIRSYSPELASFSGAISAKQVTGSNFVSVSSVAGTPQEALMSLRALRDIFPSLSGYLSGESVAQVIQNPQVSAKPTNEPDRKRVLLIAAMLGAAAACAVTAFGCICSETVQTRDGARSLLDARVLAVIGHEKRRRSKKTRERAPLLVTSPSVSLAFTEEINSVCSYLDHKRRERGVRVILVTSVGENEGKSTVAANIAVALAQKGHDTALIDADLRNPTQASLLGESMEGRVSLDRLLGHDFSRDEFLAAARQNGGGRLCTLLAEGSGERSGELIASPGLGRILKILRNFDFVIIDTAPMSLFSDAQLLSEQADGAILVVRQDCVPARDINDAADELRRGRAELLGCILNDMRGMLGYGYGYGYGYGAGYGYGYGYGKKAAAERAGAAFEMDEDG